MTTYTARALSTNRLQFVINQTGHGFAVGDLIINNALAGPPIYVHSKADTLAHCQGTMMVSFLIDADNFVATQEGHISGITSQTLVAGNKYYVSASVANTLTTTAPTTVGQVILACFVADSATSGFFFGGFGELIESGSLFAWNVVTINTVMSVNNGYVINGAGILTMTLPPTSSVGDIIEVAGFSSNGWIISQNAGQIIHFGNMNTTVGVGGSLASTVRYDSVKLLSVTASPNAEWLVLTADGNITIV